MSERIAPPCPHDVGPGIPVCLRCRKEKLVETRERRRRALYATAAVALGVATIGAAGAAGMLDNELRAAGLAIAAQTTRTAPNAPQPASDESVQATPAVQVSSDTALVTPASVTTPAAVELAATIGEGRTPLRGGIFAERRGEDVTVHFDTPLARTRRPEKFEGLLRETLPLIYGALVDSAIAAIPEGSLVPAEGLTTDLPAQGLYVPVAGGRTLRVWPETRPGDDGPLVIRYRVLIAP